MLIAQLTGRFCIALVSGVYTRLCVEPHKLLSQAPGAGQALLLLTPSSREQAPPTFLRRDVLLLNSAVFKQVQNRKELGAEFFSLFFEQTCARALLSTAEGSTRCPWAQGLGLRQGVGQELRAEKSSVLWWKQTFLSGERQRILKV